MKNLIRKILKEQDWFDEFIPKDFDPSPAEQFLYSIMKNLKMVKSKNNPGWILYKDENGKALMADNINRMEKNPILWVDYREIWSKLSKNFGLNSQEINDLCKRMLEITHKRKVLTASDNAGIPSD